MNYTFKLTNRGLCSEFNSLLGFYESVIHKDCRIFIDASRSQYFKAVSIFNIFKFPDIFVNSSHRSSTIISSDKWRSAAKRRYKTKLTNQQCSNLFSYTDDFNSKLNENITKLSLPPNYNCFHIRRGDKVDYKKTNVREADRYDFKEYLTHSDPTIRTIFIMSDDYSSILEAQQYDCDIKTLTTVKQTGHSTRKDLDNNRFYQLDDLVQFFSEISIAKHAQQFIGTESSNIFRYIRNQCEDDVELISLD